MATPLTPAEVAARNSSPTLRDVLQNVAPAFNIPTHAAVLNDLAMRAEALVPSYEYGHTLTNGAGDFDQMLDTMAEYMVNPYTSTQAPFDYAMPEQAAVGWMMGGYARVRGRSARAMCRVTAPSSTPSAPSSGSLAGVSLPSPAESVILFTNPTRRSTTS